MITQRKTNDTWKRTVPKAENLPIAPVTVNV